MKNFKLLAAAALFLAAAAILSNCKKGEENLPYKYQAQNLKLPATVSNYSNPSLPSHLASLKFSIASNVTDNGATLGRVLFYDPILSKTNKTACASCHKQELGFADNVKLSTGFDGGKTARNSSTIVNPIQNIAFFWDGRETQLESMVLRPIENHVEMGLDQFDILVKKLNSVDYYKPLFKAAFGDENVTKERIASGLRQFLQSMVSSNSTFDRSDPTDWGTGNTAVFTPTELEGLNLFMGKAACAGCHSMTTNFQFNDGWADIGLETNYETDRGLGANQQGADGKFKIPSLRNVALTAPYMHDGRFATLRDVVNHYSDNIQPSANLDWRLGGGSAAGPTRMNLTDQEKNALVAFLGTFTDQQFLTDEKFSNPFK